MTYVEPKVYLTSQMRLNYEAIDEYLTDIGAHFFSLEGENDAQDDAELTGRICYRSFEPGLNRNVTRIRDDQYQYLENILSSHHGNVTEHQHFGFIIHNVSRVFTHELVRHSTGIDFTQESLRYVRLTDINMWEPDWAIHDPELREANESVMAALEYHQKWMAEHFDLDNMPFGQKKLYTSYMRRWAPEGVASTVKWTCNIRAMRHVIEQRTSHHAEEEIRLVFDQVAHIMQREVPALLQDFTRDDHGAWVPKYSKI